MRAKTLNESNDRDELEFDKVRSNLRTKVFPKMTDDEVYDFMVRLKKWANQMLGENDNEIIPSEPRGDGGSIDDARDWRDNGEMRG